MTRRILAVVGMKGPFDRLATALAEVASTTDWEIRIQHGAEHAPPGLRGWKSLSRAELLPLFSEVDAVVCHGGSGTLGDALAAGHRPIVVPRLARYGEHVNDHQREIIEALGDRVVAFDDEPAEVLADRLRTAIAEVQRGPPAAPGNGGPLLAAIRNEVGHISSTPPLRRTRLIYALCERLFPTTSR